MKKWHKLKFHSVLNYNRRRQVNKLNKFQQVLTLYWKYIILLSAFVARMSQSSVTYERNMAMNRIVSNTVLLFLFLRHYLVEMCLKWKTLFNSREIYLQLLVAYSCTKWQTLRETNMSVKTTCNWCDDR